MSDDAGRREVRSPAAPPPAGSYSQGIVAGGLLFVAGQTPRLPDGRRLESEPFDVQARQALDNLDAIAQAAGTSLRRAASVTVFLRDPARRAEFDRIYREYVGEPWPARAIVQSDLFGLELELTAVIACDRP